MMVVVDPNAVKLSFLDCLNSVLMKVQVLLQLFVRLKV